MMPSFQFPHSILQVKEHISLNLLFQQHKTIVFGNNKNCYIFGIYLLILILIEIVCHELTCSILFIALIQLH